MPRPKRSKVAPSAPTILPPKLAATLRADNVAVDSSQKSTNSDCSLGHVKRGATGRNTRGIARQEIYMSGALGGGYQQEPRRDADTNSTGRIALREVARNVDVKRKSEDARRFKKKGLEVRRVEEEVAVVPSSMPDDLETEAHSPQSNPIPHAPSTIQRPIPQKQAMPSANWRAQATPRMDSSILALGNFKRRSRQPSLLGIGRPEESPSFADFDLGGEDSFEADVAMGQSPAPTARMRQTPDKESTVAPRDTLISTTRDVHTLSSSSRKRKRSPEVLIQNSQSPTASETNQILRSSRISISSREVDSEDDDNEDGDGENEPKLPPINHRPTQPQIWNETIAPPESSSSFSQAPPANPNTLPSPKVQDQSKPKTRGRQPKPKAKSNSNPSPLKPLSTAELKSLLPQRRRTKLRNRKPHSTFDVPSDSISDSDGDNDHEPELTEPSAEDDELSFIPVPKRKSARGKARNEKQREEKISNVTGTAKTPARKTLGKGGLKTPAPAPATAATKTSKKDAITGKKLREEGRRAQKSAQNTTQNATQKQKSVPKKPQKTYSRQTRASSTLSSALSSSPPSSPPDPSVEQVASKGINGVEKKKGAKMGSGRENELNALAKKFREVDEWEMEFEVVTGSSSSPWDAR